MYVIPRTLPAALAVLTLASGCGDGASDRADDGLGCGDDTVLVDGQCVPVGSTGDETSSDGGSATTDVTSTASITGEDSSSDGGTVDLDSGGGEDSSSTGAPPTMIDLHDVIFHDNPENVADWPITTTITRLEFREGGAYVEFSKKDGDGRWPDIVPPGWEGPLQYTLGLVELIDGQWHGSAAMQYWYGLDVQGGNVALDDQIAVNWYYDGRWAEMAGYQPALGETIGVFIVAGNVRGVFDGSQSPVQERSDVVVVPMPDVDGAVHEF
jgi:hypothetical protein